MSFCSCLIVFCMSIHLRFVIFIIASEAVVSSSSSSALLDMELESAEKLPWKNTTASTNSRDLTDSSRDHKPSVSMCVFFFGGGLLFFGCFFSGFFCFLPFSGKRLEVSSSSLSPSDPSDGSGSFLCGRKNIVTSTVVMYRYTVVIQSNTVMITFSPITLEPLKCGIENFAGAFFVGAFLASSFSGVGGIASSSTSGSAVTCSNSFFFACMNHSRDHVMYSHDMNRTLVHSLSTSCHQPFTLPQVFPCLELLFWLTLFQVQLAFVLGCGAR